MTKTRQEPTYSYTYMAIGLPSLPSGLADPLGSVLFTPLEPSTSLLTERVDMRNSPAFVILDSGCTKATGSRYAVNRRMKACKNLPDDPAIAFSFEPCQTTLSFADSETSVVRERLHMRNLRFTLEHTPTPPPPAQCARLSLCPRAVPLALMPKAHVAENPVDAFIGTGFDFKATHEQIKVVSEEQTARLRPARPDQASVSGRILASNTLSSTNR